MSNMEIDRVLAQIRSISHAGSAGGVGAARGVGRVAHRAQSTTASRSC